MAYDYDELFPNRFLKSGQFKGREVTLTIKSVALEEMEDKKGMKMKAVVGFKETPKQLVLNKTNGECVKGMFGRDTGAWIGKRVTFFPVTVEAFGSRQLAIRVKGSPDIASDMSFACHAGRSDFTATMKKTAGPKSNGKPAAKPAPTPEPTPPGFDAATGSAPISEEEAAAILASEREQAADDVPFS